MTNFVHSKTPKQKMLHVKMRSKFINKYIFIESIIILEDNIPVTSNDSDHSALAFWRYKIKPILSDIFNWIFKFDRIKKKF